MNMTVNSGDQINHINKMMLGTSSALGMNQLKKALSSNNQSNNMHFL